MARAVVNKIHLALNLSFTLFAIGFISEVIEFFKVRICSDIGSGRNSSLIYLSSLPLNSSNP